MQQAVAKAADKPREFFAEWPDQFSLGMAELDCEHEKIFGLLNELHGAMTAGAGREALGKLLEEVLHYVSYHFAHEEVLFLRANYPGYEKHSRQHRALIGTIREIHADFQASACEPLPQQVLEFLKNWIYEHVLREDRAFVAYLNEGGAVCSRECRAGC